MGPTSPAWVRLASLAEAARATGLEELFAADPGRPADLLLEGPRIGLDVSLQFVDREMLGLFDSLLEQSGAARLRAAMFAGDPVNATEGRAALHAVGRGAPGSSRAMLEMAGAIRSGNLTAGLGAATTVVNIGIGGSDLGPAMVAAAFADHADGPAVRFVSNVDPSALDAALADCDLASTLFIVSSKTFTTPETLDNAARARELVVGAVGPDRADRHFVAVTASPARAAAWGVLPERILAYDEAIGGRFSLSGAPGLPAAVAVGPEVFARMLAAMGEMDLHFASAPASANLPVVHATLAALSAVAMGQRSRAVVAYCERLGLLVPHLQQLTMESNGKSVASDGSPVAVSGPALWGAVGTDAQHALFQWLHQGTDPTPVDIVIVGNTEADPARRRAASALVANALAQGEALAFGNRTGAGDPHRNLPGNRPSTRILLKELSPETLGALLAFFEHSTVMQGWLMGINPFDQFGVEHGKAVARAVEQTTVTHPLDEGSVRWSAATRWLAGD